MSSRMSVLVCAVSLAIPTAFAQYPDTQFPGGSGQQLPPQQQQQQQPAALLPPEQLDNLVSPIALYPDPLLSQVLSASTYPLEIVEANQWLGQNRNLQGSQLMDAARQQNWDASVQAMVAFPQALALMAGDIRWTNDLGNAFLAQQADVMAAVQRMRARAQANGKLNSTPQQVVRMDDENDIEIMPADPQVIYVPVYRPEYVWGPPVWGVYPPLWYPGGYSLGFSFGPGLFIGAFFPGWGGWGGWGWGCGWGGRSVYVNTAFFHHYGYRGGYYGRAGGGYAGRMAWSHDPGHRMGIPYANHSVATRYGGTYGTVGRGSFGGNRGGGGQWNGGQMHAGSPSGAANSGGWQRFSGSGSRGSGQSFREQSPNMGTGRGYGGSQNYSRGNVTPGFGGSTSRSYEAPGRSYQQAPQARSYSWGGGGGGSGYQSPRSYAAPPAYSSPRGSGGGSGYSSPRSYSAPSPGFSSPRSYSGGSSGHSGGRSGGGGGGFSGGGGGGRHR